MENYGKKLVVLSDDRIRMGAIGRVLNGFALTRDGKPIDGGLYDKTIFGSDTTCNCFRNLRTPGSCSCGVTIYRTEDLIKTYAFYESKIPVINSILSDTFVDGFRENCPSIYNKICEVHGISTITLEHIWATTFSASEEETGITVMLKGITFNLKIEELQEDSPCRSIGLIGLKSISKGQVTGSDADWLYRNITNCIPIPSIPLRPWSLLWSKGEKSVSAHPLTSQYSALITVAEWLNYSSPSSFAFRKIEGGTLNSIDFATLCYGYQNVYNKVMSFNKLLAPSKQSTVRSTIRQRISKSSRTTITNDINLPLDTVGVPFSLFYEANKVDIIDKLTELYPDEDAISLYLNLDSKAIECTREMANVSCVCIERAPTLHKFNVLAFKIQLHTDDKISMTMNPLICKPFNADFDGDQMAQWYITDEKLADQIMLKMSPRAYWVYEKDAKALWKPNSQMLLGLFYLTNPNPTHKDELPQFDTLDSAEESFLKGLIDFDQLIQVGVVQSSYGRLKVSQILEQDIDELLGADKAICAKNLNIVMSALYPFDTRLEKLKQLQELGLRAVTEIGVTFLTPTEMGKLSEGIEGVDEILNSDMPNDVKIDKIEEMVTSTIKERAESIPSLLDQLNGSDKITLQQLGEISKGKVVFKDGVPIYENDSIVRGATERTYVEHSMTERKISELKHSLVSGSGYMSRQLVDAAEQIIFKADYTDPNNTGVYIPSSQAVGRTDMQGNLITSIPKEEKCLVRSFAGTQSNYIGYDCLRKDIFVYTDGGMVGTSVMSSIGEQLLQGGLELKHAGKFTSASDVCFTSRHQGTIRTISKNFFLIESNGEEFVYPLPSRYQPTKLFKEEVNINKGDVLFYSSEVIRPDAKLLNFASLVGGQVPGKPLKELSLSMAIGEGVIQYDFDNGIVDFNGIKSPIDYTSIYFVPNGSRLNSFDIINSGIFNITLLSKFENVPNEIRFYAFWLIFKGIWGSVPINCEYAEILYHILMTSGKIKPLRKVLTQDLSLISSLNFGWNKMQLRRFLGKDIGNSLLTEFILNSKEKGEK